MRVVLPLLMTLLAMACTTSKRSDVRKTPCVLAGVTREAQCLELEVPENPDLPQGRRISIHVAVVPATGIRPLTDAVFVFAGGPGQSATELAGGVLPLFAGLEARRDIVFVDQRGTGGSQPLRCTDSRKQPLAETFDEAANDRTLAECRARFTDAGVDLAQYATWVAMADIERVRQTLGYGRINLWGASYGTRAALEYARQFPESVRSVVLDGVAPALTPLPIELSLDTEAALQAMATRCTSCIDGGSFDSAVTALLADTTPVEVADPSFGTRTRLELSRAQRLGLVRGPLYAPTLAAALPYAVGRARDGDFAALIGLNTGLGGGSLYEGMHFSVLCAEDVPRIDDAALARLASTRVGTAMVDEYRRHCRDWPVRPVPAAFFDPPRFTAPTLLLSGGTDPATPPRHAAAIASTLPHATHLVGATLGHGVSLSGCGPSLVHEFLSRADATTLDGGCLAELPHPTFFEAPVP